MRQVDTPGPHASAGRWEALALFTLVAAGHALGTAVVYQFDHTPASGVSFFPADGVTLAALLLVSRRSWPVVLTATYAAEFVSHLVLRENLLTGLGLALSNTVGPLAGAVAVRWFAERGERGTERDPGRDLGAFLAGGVVLGPLVDALTGPPFARLASGASPYLETTARWWTGDALGCLIVGSALLAWARPGVRLRATGRLEPAACALVLTVLSFGVFFVWSRPLAYLVLVPLGWAALRFDARGATGAVVLVTAIAEWATVTGQGPFAAASPDEVRTSLWLLQLFLAVAALAALVVAADVARAQRAEAARRTSERAELEARQAMRAERQAEREAARQAERSRLARELHDSVSQALFAASMRAGAAQRRVARAGVEVPGLGEELSTLRELVSAALAEMRALIFEMRPEALADEGLLRALERQATALRARTGLDVTVEGPPERLPLPIETEEHLYRLALEALNNAVKHAGASCLAVRVTQEDGHMEITVTDDGQGFDPALPRPGHLGLHTMRERAQAVGGALEVAGQPGQGTVVRCRLPRPRPGIATDETGDADVPA